MLPDAYLADNPAVRWVDFHIVMNECTPVQRAKDLYL